jgi:hypothetical protein
MKWNSSLSIETDVPVRAASRLTAQLRSEKWFNIGGNRSIRARYTTRLFLISFMLNENEKHQRKILTTNLISKL